MLKELLERFFQDRHANGFELYSEAGLQHELALHLRAALPDHSVRLEYPVTRIMHPAPSFQKKVLDIYISGSDGAKYLVELKVPKDNCGTPKEMYRAMEDVLFAEQLAKHGSTACYCILITERSSFGMAPQADSPIYARFNGDHVRLDSIDEGDLPEFLKRSGPLKLAGCHTAPWKAFEDAHGLIWKHYMICME
jgi:hypothetical protein